MCVVCVVCVVYVVCVSVCVCVCVCCVCKVFWKWLLLCACVCLIPLATTSPQYLTLLHHPDTLPVLFALYMRIHIGVTVLPQVWPRDTAVAADPRPA